MPTRGHSGQMHPEYLTDQMTQFSKESFDIISLNAVDNDACLLQLKIPSRQQVEHVY